MRATFTLQQIVAYASCSSDGNRQETVVILNVADGGGKDLL
jgi:hypothetical protein